jgi:hypothetical protein
MLMLFPETPAGKGYRESQTFSQIENALQEGFSIALVAQEKLGILCSPSAFPFLGAARSLSYCR